jgi:hypothetical protein
MRLPKCTKYGGIKGEPSQIVIDPWVNKNAAYVEREVVR